VVTLGETSQKEGLKLLDYLRENNIPADTDYQNKSLKAALRRANDFGARFVLILGEDEIKKQVVTVRDMGSSVQKEVRREDLVKEIQC
jgi:histidyl-tRNA synthetase